MNPKQIGVGLVVLAVIAIAVWQFGSFKNTTTTSNPTPMAKVSPTGAMMKKTGDSMMTDYADGQYSATGHYQSPAQQESVEVEVTLENGVVTDAVFTPKAVHETSKKMQGLFAEGFKEQVVGKPVDKIALTVVNGSSLTPKGFMDALEQIKKQAQT